MQQHWEQLSAARLKAADKAARRLVRSLEVLNLAGDNAISRTLGQEVPVEWEHYPPDDVRDERRRSQYYYHSHADASRGFAEHGHFHLFVHSEELGLVRRRRLARPAPAHLFAVSMRADGLPAGFFTVNQWVTKGPWLKRESCERGLDAFAVRRGAQMQPVSDMLSSLVALYREKLSELIADRDLALERERQGRSTQALLLDRKVEVLSFQPIDLVGDIETLERLVDCAPPTRERHRRKNP